MDTKPDIDRNAPSGTAGTTGGEPAAAGAYTDTSATRKTTGSKSPLPLILGLLGLLAAALLLLWLLGAFGGDDDTTLDNDVNRTEYRAPADGTLDGTAGEDAIDPLGPMDPIDSSTRETGVNATTPGVEGS